MSLLYARTHYNIIICIGTRIVAITVYAIGDLQVEWVTSDFKNVSQVNKYFIRKFLFFIYIYN